jgi:hypothetical protein
MGYGQSLVLQWYLALTHWVLATGSNLDRRKMREIVTHQYLCNQYSVCTGHSAIIMELFAFTLLFWSCMRSTSHHDSFFSIQRAVSMSVSTCTHVACFQRPPYVLEPTNCEFIRKILKFLILVNWCFAKEALQRGNLYWSSCSSDGVWWCC